MSPSIAIATILALAAGNLIYCRFTGGPRWIAIAVERSLLQTGAIAIHLANVRLWS